MADHTYKLMVNGWYLLVIATHDATGRLLPIGFQITTGEGEAKITELLTSGSRRSVLNVISKASEAMNNLEEYNTSIEFSERVAKRMIAQVKRHMVSETTLRYQRNGVGARLDHRST